ncbi:uncharacterized protein LOC142575013 [Dermacentor variabilis]|uniref:uncharacterized protein LOC142575013 n=1 Tax=Dermacentor variabilis TaxID=34621 RepID=UPI003F5B9FD8
MARQLSLLLLTQEHVQPLSSAIREQVAEAFTPAYEHAPVATQLTHPEVMSRPRPTTLPCSTPPLHPALLPVPRMPPQYFRSQDPWRMRDNPPICFSCESIVGKQGKPQSSANGSTRGQGGLRQWLLGSFVVCHLNLLDYQLCAGGSLVEQETQSYQSRAHRLATLFIMTAGSANACQFPMMFIVYGGVPFLLAYLAFLCVVTFPVMCLENNLAQFTGDGNSGIFSAVPLFIGLGYTMSLYAIVHVVGDSVPVSDQLLYLLDSLRDAAWNDCPNGLLLAPNRTCYVPRHAFSLCRTTRARLTEAFRRQPLSNGVPAVAEGPDLSVVLLPPKVYRSEMADCLPGVYNYLQPYQPCVCDTLAPCSSSLL